MYPRFSISTYNYSGLAEESKRIDAKLVSVGQPMGDRQNTGFNGKYNLFGQSVIQREIAVTSEWNYLFEINVENRALAFLD